MARRRDRRSENVRARLERERAALVEELRQLRLSPQTDRGVPRGAAGDVLDEGDQAQASERQDIEFSARERMAGRITQLAAALERLTRGEYGRCQRCGRAIEPQRLQAVPEARLCRACQAEVERQGGEGERRSA